MRGWLRYGLPKEFGPRRHQPRHGRHPGTLGATRAPGLHNDLQDESDRRQLPQVIMMSRFGTDAQKAEWIGGDAHRDTLDGIGLTEPDHGSDATWMETTAVRDGDSW